MSPPDRFPMMSLLNASEIVVPIGNAPPRPAAMDPGMSGVARMTAGMKIAPTSPEIRIDDRTPRGAWRLASSVSSPNVPAVSNPKTTNAAMKKPNAHARAHENGSARPCRACLLPPPPPRVCWEGGGGAGGLHVGEDQQDDRE